MGSAKFRVLVLGVGDMLLGVGKGCDEMGRRLVIKTAPPAPDCVILNSDSHAPSVSAYKPVLVPFLFCVVLRMLFVLRMLPV